MAFKVWKGIIGGCLVLFQLSPLCGQSRNENDDAFHQYIQEFFFTEAVYAQEKRELQFTFSNYYQQQNEIQLLMEYGFTDRLQMEVELSNVTNRNQAGFTGELGFLYNAWNSPGTSFSIATGVGIEREDEDESGEGTEASWEAKAVFAKQLGPVQTHTDLSLEIPGDETQWAFNTALLVPFGRVKGIFEVNSRQEGQKNWQITPGMVFSTWKRSEIALGLPVALSGGNDVGFVVRLTIEFEGEAD
ncbi:MAG: hypothetical protein MJA30_07520 [Cytophagales bacterium]|nr:hypothetical protein [Cytophagales bacterium]